MADDMRKRGPQDRSRINVNEPWELRHWSQRFGVAGDELKEAVQKVGANVADVHRYFVERSSRLNASRSE